MSFSRGRVRRALCGFASPTLIIALTATVFVGVALADVVQVMQRSQRLQTAVDRQHVEIVAETAALRFAAAPPGEYHGVVAGIAVDCVCRERVCELTCRPPDRGPRRYRCELLPGAGPSALAYGRAARTDGDLWWLGGGRRIGAADAPSLDAQAVASAPRANARRGFRRDGGVALRFFSGGTDREDYVWADGSPAAGSGPASGLLVVPGHLWIPPAAGVFELHLDRDLVVVVQGNLYLGSSVRVHGRGRLLFATSLVDDAVAFADRDGSGAWSAGDALCDAARFHGVAEGAGAVYLGLGSAPAQLHCDGGLVVQGQLHVAGRAQVLGPIVLVNGGVTDLSGGRAGCLGRAHWSFRPERERVPGFAVHGPPRPGLLQRVE